MGQDKGKNNSEHQTGAKTGFGCSPREFVDFHGTFHKERYDFGRGAGRGFGFEAISSTEWPLSFCDP